MKVYYATYYEINDENGFMEYGFVVVEKDEEAALDRMIRVNPHTKSKYWVIVEINTDTPINIEIFANYSE